MQQNLFTYVLGGLICFGLSVFSLADDVKPVRLYLDADRTTVRASGVSIERGIRTALDEVNNRIGDRPVELVIRDHHGSAVRSKRHLKEFLQDPDALAVFSGLHSPPLLENLRFIHENDILILDPWAAAGPLTRYSGKENTDKENWVFRLSVDDSKAGKVIVDNALAEGFRKPFLLLEETGWGKSNYRTMTAALAEKGIAPAGVQWFNWNLGETGAKIMLRGIQTSGADVILMVANAPEGKTFIRAALALADEENRKVLPVRSHWGITGGDFAEEITADMRKNLDLQFLQTRFSFNSSEPTPLSGKVLARAVRLFPDVATGSDITAPTGFIHAYDLTRLMLAALSNMELSGDIHKDRQDLRSALENIRQPVEGLIKIYRKPYSVYTENNPDAHEALGAEDLVMSRYDDENRIVIVGNKE